MPTIPEIREKYPQYSDMSDEQLADALHSKFYSDMPRADFNTKIGLTTQPAPQATPAPANTAKDVPRQISIPIPGVGSFKPSLIGMAKGLFEGAKSAATLPRDVYEGKVDPLSDEGIGRTTEMAAMTALPSAGRAVVARTALPAVSELQAAATPTYKELVKTGNTIAVPGKVLSEEIATELHPQALRESSAPRTYGELGKLSRGNDLNDVAIARDNLRDIANGISENKLIRVTGPDAKAARAAMDQLDTKIEALSPGWVDKMKTADANWAVSKRIEKVQKEADKGQKGRLGSFDTNETRAKGYAPEELKAIKRAHQGGMLGTGLNALGAGLNPFHGGISGGVSAALHIPAAISSGGASLLGIPAGMVADVAAKTLRQHAINQAIRQITSRAPLAQGRSGVIAGMPGLAVPPPTLGLLPFLPPPQQ